MVSLKIYSIRGAPSTDELPEQINFQLYPQHELKGFKVVQKSRHLRLSITWYFSNAGSVVSCLEAETRKETRQGRTGGNHWPSPVYADEKIYFFEWERI